MMGRRVRPIARYGAVAVIVASLPGSVTDALADETPPGHLITDQSTVEAIYSGNTLTGTMPEDLGAIWAEFYCPNGISIYSLRDDVEVGHWRVRPDGMVCFAYNPPGYQVEHCDRVYLQDDGSYIFHSDQVMDYYVQTSVSGPPQHGDPLHLQEKMHYGCGPAPSV
jgi:hypothetical protein